MSIQVKHTLATEAWAAVMSAHNRMTRRLDAELRDEADLPLGWYEVLLVLATAKGQRLRMTDVADRLLLSKSATTRFIDRLEAKGLVERKICPSDRRGMEVSLTHDGEDMFRTAGRIHKRGIEEHFGSILTDSQLTTLRDALDQVAEHNGGAWKP